jgi:hypothetical protein
LRSIQRLPIPHLNGSFPEFISGWTIGADEFNAKTQRRKAAKTQGKHCLFFAPWHLCVFALIFSVGAGFALTNTLAHRTGFV